MSKALPRCLVVSVFPVPAGPAGVKQNQLCQLETLNIENIAIYSCKMEARLLGCSGVDGEMWRISKTPVEVTELSATNVSKTHFSSCMEEQ